MLQYLKNIFAGFITPLQGIKITSSYIFKPKVTKRYPEQYDPYPSLPESTRNRIYVDMGKCLGCQLCSKNCPVGCIDIEIIKAVPNDPNPVLDENGNPKKLIVSKFDIDFALCCFCMLCEESCNRGAIYRTSIFDYSTYSREKLIYSFSKLTPEEVEKKKELLEKFDAEKRGASDATNIDK